MPGGQPAAPIHTFIMANNPPALAPGHGILAGEPSCGQNVRA